MLCAFKVAVDQSMWSRFFRSRSAYSVILKNHWRMCRCSTGVTHRSHSPAITCSLASTVMQEGHQLTGASFCTASPRLKNCTKSHWVHP